ncbi:MAG: D-aspartate ligase [Thermoleophilaceae bacterium]|nr:D-aspartate ligase [Thermoleophilaceae bacterium]
MASDRSRAALACLVGGVDLARPLALARIRVAAVAEPGDPVRLSRATARSVDKPDHWRAPDDFVASVAGLCESIGGRPVLFYEADGDLLAISRGRDRLGAACRFLLPPPEVVEDLLDKARFQALAQRLGLPVPAAEVLGVGDGARPALRPPFLVKPLSRRGVAELGLAGKAIVVRTGREVEQLRGRIAASGTGVLAQEIVPGPESRIESYHAYRDAGGRTLGEFTGRKLRTWPVEYGHTTALVTTDAEDVRELGRDVLDRLELPGVAKVDFKRDPAGALRLLEVNPRFNLWHHAGAVAGVNLPAIAHADLTGRPLPASGPAAPGVTWCDPHADRWAWTAGGGSPAGWLRFVARCRARSGLGWDDPMPFVRGVLLQRVSERLRTPAGAS